LNQAQALKELGTIKILKVLELQVSEAQLLERCANKRVDKEMGMTHNLKTLRIPKEVPVDRLVKREYDSDNVTKTRLKIYNEEIGDVRRFYGFVVHTIDAEKPPLNIFEEAKQKITKRPLTLFFAGAPGSGKGDKCERLVASLGLVHVSPGEVVKRAGRLSKDGELAQLAVEKNEKVPDDVMARLVAERVFGEECTEKGWLLDGFPRTKEQAELLKNAGVVPDKFIILEVSSEYLLDQAIHRRVDTVSGKVYDLKHGPFPTEEAITARLKQRKNDSTEEVTKRYTAFVEEAEAIANVYKELVEKIDGVDSADKVYEKIVKVLHSDAKAVLLQATFRGHQERKVARAQRKFMLIAPPGSDGGKKRLSTALASRYGVILVSAGDLLRADATGQALLLKGETVPDSLVAGLVKKRLSEFDCKSNGWLLEGFPRTGPQLAELENEGIKASKVVRICVADGKIANTGVQIQQVYNEQVDGLLEALAKCNYLQVARVDGNRHIEIVIEDIRRFLESRPWRIVLNGPPHMDILHHAGGGKGAQIAKIVEKLGCHHMTPAILTHKAIMRGTSLGLEAKALKDSNLAIPDSLQIALIAEELNSLEFEAKGWVLDSFPGNENLVALMNQHSFAVDRIILVEWPQAELTAHLTSCRIDPEDGEIYFLDGKILSEEIVGRLQHREADHEENVNGLLNPYYAARGALVTQYSKKCVIVNASGLDDDQTWGAVCSALYSTALKAAAGQSGSCDCWP